MNYSLEFKNKVFQVFRYRKDLKEMINAIEANNHTKVRYCLEDAYDDRQYFKIDRYGIKIIYKSRKFMYDMLLELYSEFMDMFTKQLDKQLYETESNRLL